MRIQELFAVVATADMDRAETFYTSVMGRGPDERPMDGLIQWRGLPENLQIVQAAENAGRSMITIITPDLTAARQELREAGLKLGEDIQGDFGIIAQIDDPDGNRLTLAESAKHA